MKRNTAASLNLIKLTSGVKNPIYRCPALNSNGTKQCIFTGRMSSMCQHLQANDHIFEDVEYKKEETPLDYTKSIIKEIAQLTAGLQLSLRQVTNDVFNTFIYNIMIITTRYVNDKDIKGLFIPQNLYQGMSREKLREQMIKISAEKSQDSIKELKSFSKFASLAVDAGLVKKHQLLEFKLVHPYSNIKTVLLLSTKFEEEHSADNFFIKLKEAIDLAHQNKIHIVSVIADNVAYQRCALNHESFDSHINQSEDENIKSLIYMSCCCHNIDLIVTYMINEIDIFKNTTKCAVTLAGFSRKKAYSAYFKTKAPSIPATRWLYLFDFTEWILNNEGSITRFMNDLDINIACCKNEETGLQLQSLRIVSLEDYKKVNMMLKPLRKVNDILERDDSFIGIVVPLIELAAKEIRELKKKELFENDQTPDILNNVIAARFNSTATTSFLCLAFLLTPLGRYTIGLTSDCSEELRKEEEEKVSKISKAYNEMKGIYEDIIPPTQKVKYGKKYAKFIDKHVSELRNKQNFKKKLAEIENARDPVEHIFTQVQFNADQALISHLSRLRYNPDKIECIKKEFQVFLFDRTGKEGRIINRFCDSNPYNLWNIIEANNILPNLSEYAKRILSIVASEATIERLFSSVKRVLDNRQNTNIDLLNSYLNLMQPHNTEYRFDSENVQKETHTESDENRERESKGAKNKLQQQSIKNYFIN